MSEFKEIGVVEILATRIYPLDPQNSSLIRTEVSVEPGTYRVFSDGFSHFWLMHGHLTLNSIRLGDGMFTFTPRADMTVDIEVQFTSLIYGPDEWTNFLKNEPVAIEGHPDQRLRFSFHADAPRPETIGDVIDVKTGEPKPPWRSL
jgi:hypothetical protein